ncbi:hypothetical protein J2786_004461 [Chryseobacterium vietnamense]|jgi:hypothetical protein|uniref:Uncharacterized protein n=1 Tax=Chryseobacterium vietnamense TaxID=866785 RepID=A0ACC6JET2_9FLAO|nr:hypothetical protein [Chryseobacterium vietnamense]MDR6461307.1 hypothetical protein [Chryseobacterium vietnamense]
MNLTEEQKKGQEAFFRIISEAWENEDFKKYLIEHPEEALEKFFGKKTPMGKKIKVTDQSDPDYLYINIPVKPQRMNKEEEIKSTEESNNRVITDYKGLYNSLQKINKRQE